MTKPDLDEATNPDLDRWSPRQLTRLLHLALDEPADPAGLLEAALDPSSSLDDLRALKLSAKRLVDTLAPGQEHDTVRLAYHLAVAQAWLRFGARISRTSPDKRRALYREFAAAMSGHPIALIFERAAASEP
jgi:hypothetical protein